MRATAIAADIGDSLVAQAASGDEIAFARIVAAHHDDMARVSFIVCRDVQLAQEAARAAWPIAWRKLSTVRDPAKLRPWLLAIAANKARGLVRRQGRRALREIALDPLPDAAAPGVTDPAERIAVIDLANALARLDPSDRTVVGRFPLTTFTLATWAVPVQGTLKVAAPPRSPRSTYRRP